MLLRLKQESQSKLKAKSFIVPEQHQQELAACQELWGFWSMYWSNVKERGLAAGRLKGKCFSARSVLRTVSFKGLITKMQVRAERLWLFPARWKRAPDAREPWRPCKRLSTSFCCAEDALKHPGRLGCVLCYCSQTRPAAHGTQTLLSAGGPLADPNRRRWLWFITVNQYSPGGCCHGN